MKKLLMITIELPYPPSSGGRMKSWNMLKSFSDNFDVTLVTPLKYGSDELEEFQRNIDLGGFHFDKVERDRTPFNLLKSYALGLPLNVYRSASPKLKAKVAEIIHKFDIVVLDHYESYYYLPKNYCGNVIFHTHNATYLMWERYAKGDDGLAMRAVASIEAKRVKDYERQVCDKASLVFAAPNDIEKLCELGCDQSKFRETYHLGDDSQLALPQLQYEDTSEQLFYVGTLNWEANVDGLLWFLADVWPQLKKIHPSLSFKIAGGKPDQRLVDAVKSYGSVELW
ncbi:MAG: hypothetical protein RL336_1094 [Pseudomonadota bacterium]|jgi:glycosyltransferase involved in cell wall biosynthesis